MSDRGTMLTFAKNGERFTLRVAGACLHDGCVLLHRAIEDDFWVLPGGRVHHGESTADALARELAEELPVPTTIERLLWVAENFFLVLGERYHEIGFYYQFSMPPNSPWLGSNDELFGREGDTALVFRWFPVSDLTELPLYPAFLRQGLVRIPTTVEPVVEDDDETTYAHPYPD